MTRREHLGEILVAAAREADDDELGVEVERARERVRALERGDDPLGLGEPVERGERLLVGARHVRGAAGVAERGVLGADARVVEAGRDRVRVGDLAVVVGEHRRAGAVEDGGAARAEARGAGGLDADEPHARRRRGSRRTSPIAFEPPPTHAIDGLRQPALGGEHLLARLVADHALEVAHELGVRRRADAGADQVVRRLDVRDPVADRLARRLLQRPRAELDRRAPRRRAGASARRSAPGGACPRRPCRRRSRARSARRRWPSRRRAGRRRSRRRSAACRAAARARPGRARCSACARRCGAGPRASGRRAGRGRSARRA